ncbi:NfeD family protein [Niveispirillum fermenti]|uniref:NfeD family protein n=1 Tax=Niveispirillum fermenti TaxID=1233113 RepID=UPI003A8639FF
MDGLRILFWYWWCLALALAALEMFIPGAAFLWVAGAAGLTGLVVLAVDLPEPVQVALFGALAVAAWLLSRRYAGREPLDNTATTLNRRADQYVGRVLVLEEALSNGYGRARIGDSVWRVAGNEELPVGTRVRVTRVDGATLHVEPA